MIQNNIHQKNRVFAPIIVGLSLFMIIFIVYPLYIEYVDTNTQMSLLENTKREKQAIKDSINTIKTEFNGSGTDAMMSKVRKYNRVFETSKIMSEVMLNEYTQGNTLSPARIHIGSISVDKGKKLPSGLSLGNVSVAISADTPDQIIDYITYLVNESEYAFTIDSLSLPLDTAIEAQERKGLSLSLSLGVYYFE